jgi:hypothetical protein
MGQASALARLSFTAAPFAFLRPLAFDSADSVMRKSSIFFPALIAAVSHRGFNPRPAQVSLGSSGLRYLGAIDAALRWFFQQRKASNKKVKGLRLISGERTPQSNAYMSRQE